MKSKIFPSVLFVLLCLATVPLSATTFVMVSDENLADGSPVVVEARVMAKENAPTSGRPSTDYQVEVEAVVKGNVPGSSLIVRTPGGVRPDGIGLKLWGIPEFRVGERVVLFLSPAPDGTFRIAHHLLGAFREVDWQGRKILARNLAGTHELALEGIDAPARGPRDRAAFLNWIRERSTGAKPAASYFLEISDDDVTSIHDQFTQFEDNQGRALRWPDFDSGATVRWRVSNANQPGLTLQQVIDAFRAGMQAWSGDNQSLVSYGYGSSQTTGLTGGLTNFDGTNAIAYEDPNNNNSFEAPFSCNGGGVLAIGGPWFNNQTHVFRGTTYRNIIGGDIITNAGLQCYFDRSGNRVTAAAELFAHELGHTLGFGHACGDDSSPSCGSSGTLNDALMRAFVHNDGRGARLGADDLTAIRTIYGNGVGNTPVPTAPTDLTAAALSSTTVELLWQDNADNETSYRIEQRTEGGGFVQIVNSLPANSEAFIVTGLTPLTLYDFRVRARNGGGNSGYSNIATLRTPSTLPDDPDFLTATALSPTAVQLTWEDFSNNETNFLVEARSPVSEYFQIASTGPNANSLVVGGLVSGRPYTFRVRATNGNGNSGYTNESSATPFDGINGPCTTANDTLCLLDDRFRVKVQWRNQFANGTNGIGSAQAPFAQDTSGIFTFFDPRNTELIVKAIDATGIGQGYWFFYGALSTVEYWITVTDTTDGSSNTYHNPPGELCGFADTQAFQGPASSPASGLRAFSLPLPEVDDVTSIASPVGTCVDGTETLCLFEDRFEVKVDWFNFRNGQTGTGKAVPGTTETGYFWFFGPENIELVLKVLDNTAAGNNFWVFYGALSDVVYDITVTDTVTGRSVSYNNEAENFCGNADTVGLLDEPLP
ncbi:MAG: fibronectin type III domain-containing protein [Acidobacteriota bacterium]